MNKENYNDYWIDIFYHWKNDDQENLKKYIWKLAESIATIPESFNSHKDPLKQQKDKRDKIQYHYRDDKTWHIEYLPRELADKVVEKSKYAESPPPRGVGHSIDFLSLLSLIAPHDLFSNVLDYFHKNKIKTSSLSRGIDYFVLSEKVINSDDTDLISYFEYYLDKNKNFYTNLLKAMKLKNLNEKDNKNLLAYSIKEENRQKLWGSTVGFPLFNMSSYLYKKNMFYFFSQAQVEIENEKDKTSFISSIIFNNKNFKPNICLEYIYWLKKYNLDKENAYLDGMFFNKPPVEKFSKEKEIILENLNTIVSDPIVKQDIIDKTIQIVWQPHFEMFKIIYDNDLFISEEEIKQEILNGNNEKYLLESIDYLLDNQSPIIDNILEDPFVLEQLKQSENQQSQKLVSKIEHIVITKELESSKIKRKQPSL